MLSTESRTSDSPPDARERTRCSIRSNPAKCGSTSASSMRPSSVRYARRPLIRTVGRRDDLEAGDGVTDGRLGAVELFAAGAKPPNWTTVCKDLPFIESGSHVDKYIHQIDTVGPKCDYSG